MRKNDESEDHTSSESAGIVRGAARTATTLSRRGIVGRLPKPAVKPPTVISRGPMPRVLPKKVPLKHVAKVSDRLSTGFDAYDAASSSNTNLTSATKKGSSQVIQYGKRFLQFSGTLIKNTIMGAAVFETYEMSIQYFDEIQGNHHMSRSSDSFQHNHADAYERTSIQQHFASGLLAGSAHSILHMSFQSASHFYTKRHQLQSIPKQMSISSIFSYSVAHTIHHSIAHALLFSSYEYSKRVLFGESSVHLQAISPFTEKDSEDNGDREHALQDVLMIGLAGGIAGQIQHITSHYTEIWLRVGEDDSVRSYWQERSKLWSHWRLIGAGPSMRSICMSFPPSGIGFIAFEFGKTLLD